MINISLDVSKIHPAWDILCLLCLLYNYKKESDFEDQYSKKIAILESKINYISPLSEYTYLQSSYWYIRALYHEINNEYDIKYYIKCKNECEKNGILENCMWNMELIENKILKRSNKSLVLYIFT